MVQAYLTYPLLLLCYLPTLKNIKIHKIYMVVWFGR